MPDALPPHAPGPLARLPAHPGEAGGARVLALGVNWFSAGSGGLDRVFHDLATHLPAAGIDLDGLVLGPPDTAALSGGRVQAFGRPGDGMAARLLGARRAIRARLRQPEDARPALLAVHFAFLAAPALDLLGQLPMVVHFHGPWADEAAAEGAGLFGQSIRRAIECAVYRRASRVITLSTAFASVAAAAYGIPAARLRVVPGSVDLARFAPRLSRGAARRAASDAMGWPGPGPQQGPVLLAVRRLVRRMGLGQLIEAMPRIWAAWPGAHLLIAGQGEEEARLRALAASLGAGTRIRFLGFLPDELLPLAYWAADLTLVPSRALEGFGLAAAESLAAGTPALVTPVGGLPEIVRPLSPALVMASGEPADIAAAALWALSGHAPDQAACRAFAEERFCPRLAAKAVADLYREALCEARH